MSTTKKYFIASPRGFCAGVDRAIDVVELALEVYGAPVYVKHAIVHNTHVVKRLEKKGAIFTDDVASIPTQSHVVFSAHGSPPEHFEQARRQGLHIIDATCPLVTKVHLEVKNFSQQGYTIIMIGHKGHVEPIGTLGNAKKVQTHLVDTKEEAEELFLQDEKIAVVTQTTLSVDETKDILALLEKKFPHAVFPKKQDICYATTNRQEAVKVMLPHIDTLLVVGSTTSSNSNRLREVGEKKDIPSYLIDDVSKLKPEWIDKACSVGLTSGASVPDDLVQEVAANLETKGFSKSEIKHHTTEEVHFTLPHDFVKEINEHSEGSDILEKHKITSGKSMRV